MPTPALAQPPLALQSSQIEIAYVPPSNRNFQPIYDRVKNRKVLEDLQQFLAPLRLPRKLTVKIEQCGAPSRPYQPQGRSRSATSSSTRSRRLPPRATRVATNDDRRRVHPGRGLRGRARDVRHPVDPGLGARRDAADRLALVMLQFGEDLALRTIRGTTAFFLASKKNLDRQRVRRRELARGAALLQLSLHRLWRFAHIV